MKQLCLLLVALLSLAVSAGPVEEVLGEFEKAPSAAVANRYFALLQQQEITDQLVKVAPNAPLDTLRQQVWYWAAEWLFLLFRVGKVAAFGTLCHAETQ